MYQSEIFTMSSKDTQIVDAKNRSKLSLKLSISQHSDFWTFLTH